jgi:alpha-mannosidase
MYEDQRNRGRFTLTTGFALAKAVQTNLLEEDGEALAVQGNSVTLDVTPYQIITLRLIPQK